MRRPIALDAAVEGNRSRRSDELTSDVWFLWTYLVGLDGGPSGNDLLRMVEALESRGFGFLASPEGYRVFPAEISKEVGEFRTRSEAMAYVAARGGGILLSGHGTALALVADPNGVAQSRRITRHHLRDEVIFGEYSIWMPTCDEVDAETTRVVEARVVEAIPDVEETLRPRYGFSTTPEDLSGIGARWAVHTEVVEQTTPSELFWYQYFSSSFADRVARKSYRLAGFRLDPAAHGGLTVRLDAAPTVAYSMLDDARNRWQRPTRR